MAGATYEGTRLWDEELNRVYRELMRKLSPEDQAILKESEQEWIKFRDSNRRLISELYGRVRGTENRLFAAAKVLDVVKSRPGGCSGQELKLKCSPTHGIQRVDYLLPELEPRRLVLPTRLTVRNSTSKPRPDPPRLKRRHREVS
jgi:hypothetical protein